jgi:prepilin-type N-terminal cleavage/methylation domain-containing protein
MHKRQDGFSLVEVMVAVGLMGGLAYFLMQQQDSSSKLQTKMNFNQDLNSVSTQIQTMLAKKANCTLTVSGRKVGQSLDFIRTGIDDPINPLTAPPIFKKNLFEKNKMIGNSQLQIESISIVEKKDELGVVIGDAIRVKFRAGRMGSGGVFVPIKAVGSTNLSKDFLINGVKNPLGFYTSCYSESGNMVETAIQEACTSMGAVWDAATKKCKLTNLPKCIMVEGSACGTVFTQEGSEMAFDVKVFGRRKCTQEYKRNGFPCMGDKSFTRSCTCHGSGCTCSFPSVGCYSRKAYNCFEDPEPREIKSKKCCRPD